MCMNNPFGGFGLEAVFTNIIYNLLMTRVPVSYEMAYNKYFPHDEDYYKSHTISNEDGYGALKKAFPKVLKALREKDEHSIIDNGKKGKGRTYTYIGVSKDPLEEERKAKVKNTLQDYVRFCKMSSGIFPMEWFSYFFENTQLLLEMRHEKDAGIVHIQTNMEQELRGIERLPVLNEHIIDKHVLSFVYHPYGKDPEAIIMHPHFLKEYNGRWFLFGYIDKTTKVTNFALDRIETEPQIVDGIEYLPAPVGTYKNYFANIVGVSHEKETNGVEPVVIRTQSLYMHELMKSKKLHHSQKETKMYGNHDDGTYGEYVLNVEHNRELRGKILTYGEELRVMSPESLVNEIRESVKVMSGYYG